MKKDEYIATISRDQEELKVLLYLSIVTLPMLYLPIYDFVLQCKLAELQELVYKLLFEKQQMQGLSALNSKLPGKAQIAGTDVDKALTAGNNQLTI